MSYIFGYVLSDLVMMTVFTEKEGRIETTLKSRFFRNRAIQGLVFVYAILIGSAFATLTNIVFFGFLLPHVDIIIFVLAASFSALATIAVYFYWRSS